MDDKLITQDVDAISAELETWIAKQHLSEPVKDELRMAVLDLQAAAHHIRAARDLVADGRR